MGWIPPYFINEKKIQKISSDTRTGHVVDNDMYWPSYKELKLGENKAIAFSICYATGSTDEIYGVKNGDLVTYQIPYSYGSLNITENFIQLTVDKYDMIYVKENDYWIGHTWKPYYFFWNEGTNNFCEYGGTEITLNQLNRLKDVSEQIAEYENEGFTLLNILYRANGIININFERATDTECKYENLTLYIKYYDSTILMDDEILERNEGTYLKAINPKIAVYADFPFA